MALVVTVTVKESAIVGAPSQVSPISHSFDALVTGIADAAAYANGDAVGAKFEIGAAGSPLVPDQYVGRATLWIQTIELIDLDANNKMLDLFLADETFTSAADNAPFSLATAADAYKTAGLISLATSATDYLGAGSGKSIRTLKTLAHSIRPKAGSLWAQVIAREAVTFTNGIALRIFGFLG